MTVTAHTFTIRDHPRTLGVHAVTHEQYGATLRTFTDTGVFCNWAAYFGLRIVWDDTHEQLHIADGQHPILTAGHLKR